MSIGCAPAAGAATAVATATAANALASLVEVISNPFESATARCVDAGTLAAPSNPAVSPRSSLVTAADLYRASTADGDARSAPLIQEPRRLGDHHQPQWAHLGAERSRDQRRRGAPPPMRGAESLISYDRAPEVNSVLN